MNQTPVKNAFFWHGKSEILDKFGRMKTERQILLDGTRVNQESNTAYSTVGACDRAAQIRTVGVC